MIRAALTRWHSLTAGGRRRCALEASRWSRGTLLVLIGFGCIAMILGGLFTYGMARGGYDQLQRGAIWIVGGGYLDIIGMWGVALLLLFGGNFVRAAGWREWKWRRTGATARDAANPVYASPTTTIVGVLVAPILLFWGALGLVSFLRWLQFYFIGRPVSMWMKTLGSFDATQFLSMAIWWLVTLACLAGGVNLLWCAFRTLCRERVSSP